ncbi:MAG: hypothetical protein K6U74_00505 [Firmicutes bacterium]|nr:hypothetical protein [Bacillota bacterium]
MYVSPFSPLNRYKVTAPRNGRLYNIIDPTPRELVLLEMIKSCGVMAGFQLESILCPRKKLKSLASQGALVRYKFESENYRMNVYTLDLAVDLDLALRRLAFAQLYVRIRELVPCEAALCPAPLTGMIYFNGASYPVLVIRKGDSTVLLPEILKVLPRVLVISEELIKLELTIPYRMTTDYDLLNRPLRYAFYNESGVPEEAAQFAACV